MKLRKSLRVAGFGERGLRVEGFLPGSVVKNLPANARDAGHVGSIPGWGGSPGGENGSPLQYSCLRNPMDKGAWQAKVHGVARIRHTWAHIHS